MYRATQFLFPLLSFVALGIRPDADPPPLVQVDQRKAEEDAQEVTQLLLHPSGHLESRARPTDKEHRNLKEHHVRSSLAQISETASPRQAEIEGFRHQKHHHKAHQMRSCSQIARLARVASTSMIQLFDRAGTPAPALATEPATTPSSSPATAPVTEPAKAPATAPVTLTAEAGALGNPPKGAPAPAVVLSQFSKEPTDSEIKAQEVNIGGTEYVSEKTCESASDVLRNLISQERHVEVACMFGAVIGFLVFLVSISIWIGMGLKPPPPPYWKNGTSLCCTMDNSFDEEIDVTKDLLPVIQKLLDMTTIPDKMGVIHDGKWQTHKRFKVKKVVRVENGKHWNHYANAMKITQTFEDSLKEMPEKLRTHTQERWDAIQKDTFEARLNDPLIGPFLKKLRLNHTKNELLLFHGSPLAGGRNRNGDIIFPTEAQAPMNAIKKTGFDERLGNSKGMLGAGTYFGDSASKSDCYAGRYAEWEEGKDGKKDPGSVGEEAAMFLSRVVIGTPYITHQSLEGLRRPPCLQGHFDSNLCGTEVQFGKPWLEKGVELEVCEHTRCDSVISENITDGHPWYDGFREYVLYEKKCYPEFLIFYERLADEQ